MLRITTWRMGTPRPDLTPGAGIQAFNDMCNELGKLPGVGKVSWYFGNGGIVTVGEPDSYASADTILNTPTAQGAVAKVLNIGFGITDDQFLLAPSQVVGFTQAAATTFAVPASMSRN